LVYCCKTSYDDETRQNAFLLCSERRQKRAESISHPTAKNLSITAGLLLRYCLLKEAISDEKVKYAPNGKPYLEDENIFFSLSHSGEYAACAVCDKPVGIDIQQITDISKAAVTRFCTEREKEQLGSQKDPKSYAVKLWTLKESYLKAAGCSTKQAFQAEFEVIGDQVINGPEDYEFTLSEKIEGYIVALCKSKQH